MVKAVLCAGLYPQVAMCKVRNSRFALYTRDEGRVEPDPSSLITGVHNLPLPWLVYTEVVRGTCYIRDLTNVSNYMVLMFGGHLVCNNKNGSRIEMLGGFLHFSASKRATTIVRVCFHNPPHILPIYWLCLGGRDVRGGLCNGSKFGNQSWPAMYGVSNSLFEWSPVASDRRCKVVSQTSQSLVLVGRPTLIGHVCEIILGQSTLASSRLFNIQPCVL